MIFHGVVEHRTYPTSLLSVKYLVMRGNPIKNKVLTATETPDGSPFRNFAG